MTRVFGLHLIANAVLLVLIYVWLGIRDARAWQIGVTVLLGAAIVSAAMWLHAATWHWMSARNWRLPRAALLRFAGGALIVIAAWWLLSLIPVERAALWTASYATLKTRKPVTPESVQRIFGVTLWFVKWFVIPIVLFRRWRDFRFWGLLAVVLLLSVYVPQKLVHWAPLFKSTAAEVASLVLRWSIAFSLMLAGWLAVLWFVREEAGQGPAPQASTIDLP